MEISQIKNELFKPATIFQTGGFRPTEELGESWFGKVVWEMGDKDIPSNFEPVFTMFINNLPYVPDELISYQLLTIYMDFDVFKNLKSKDLASYFKVNCYSELDGLQKVNKYTKKIRPFPLAPILITNDTPAWEDSFNIPEEIENAILEIEEEDDDSGGYYEDIVENIYSSHKVGGYPSYTQTGVYFEDYSFVFQISSDEKAHFNVVDGGSFYFFYNADKKSWKVHCDFY